MTVSNEPMLAILSLVTQHYTMLARNRLYTAVTRGKRLVVLVGQRRALAIRSASGRKRRTKLKERLAR